ncbi:hypothetical protein EFP6CTSP_07830 [Enterococcus faecium]|nr:hypothetical protein EFP6CTSP_07830 [Enterococcus faecium]
MNIGQIDTRHATANQPNFSNGNCQPYTGVPFGMNYFAPQTTDQNGSWWFHPDDRVFQGYRLTHQQVLGWVISVICCLRRSMENYRRTPFSMLKVLTAQKKVYFARLICRSVNYVMASVLH